MPCLASGVFVTFVSFLRINFDRQAPHILHSFLTYRGVKSTSDSLFALTSIFSPDTAL